MDFSGFFQTYWPLVLLVLWFGYKWWNARHVVALLPELKSRGAVVVDVRSEAEFASGHAPASINIPLGAGEQAPGDSGLGARGAVLRQWHPQRLGQVDAEEARLQAGAHRWQVGQPAALTAHETTRQPAGLCREPAGWFQDGLYASRTRVYPDTNRVCHSKKAPLFDYHQGGQKRTPVLLFTLCRNRS